MIQTNLCDVFMKKVCPSMFLKKINSSSVKRKTVKNRSSDDYNIYINTDQISVPHMQKMKCQAVGTLYV